MWEEPESEEPENACDDNPQLPGCPKIPQSLRCMVVFVPFGGPTQVCLDENNAVWDMAGEIDAIANEITTHGFCTDLRRDTTTEAAAQIAAASLFVAACTLKAVELGGPMAGAVAGTVCTAASGAAGYKAVRLCKAKWGIEW